MAENEERVILATGECIGERFDDRRLGRDASRIADEVAAHLAGIVGSNVKVTYARDGKMGR